MTQPYTILNNGLSIPQLGFGVWQIPDGNEVEMAVSTALETGYRLIDTAAVYGNEAGVGRAINSSSVPREEIFVTTKLWNHDQGYEPALRAFDASLQRLGLDYVDLYLIHWPAPAQDKYQETWRAFEEIYKSGRAKAIGVSNFTRTFLGRLLEGADVVPAVNQIELHPRFQQTETIEYCRSHGIAVESWSPLGGQKSNLLDNPDLISIGEQYGKTSAQIVIRWHLQHGLIVIPKSANAGRIAENFDVFDFELSSEDLKKMKALDTGTRVGADPNKANFT